MRHLGFFNSFIKGENERITLFLKIFDEQTFFENHFIFQFIFDVCKSSVIMFDAQYPYKTQYHS